MAKTTGGGDPKTEAARPLDAIDAGSRSGSARLDAEDWAKLGGLGTGGKYPFLATWKWAERAKCHTEAGVVLFPLS